MAQEDFQKNEDYERSFFGSFESLSSEIYTWQKSVRPIVVPVGQIGKEVHWKSFFILFIAFLHLSSGSGICVASIWSIIYKIQYKYIFSYYINISYYSLSAGLLCIPSFLIAIAINYNGKNNALIPLMIIFLMISTGLLIFGTLVGLRFKETLKVEARNGTEILFSNNSIKENIKENMLTSLKKAVGNSSDHIRAWNIIQYRFDCCGVDDSELSKTNSLYCYTFNTSKNGCIDKIMYSVYWDLSFFIGLNSILVFIEVATVIYLIISVIVT